MNKLFVGVLLLFAFEIILVPGVCSGSSLNSEFDDINNSDDSSFFKVEDNIKPFVIGIGAETLPDWFFQQPSPEQDAFYGVGISDPGIADSLANLQAIHRALLTVSLMMGSDISGIFDDYAGDNGKKYEEMNKIKNLSPMVGRFSVVDSFVTRFKEKMFLIKFVKNNTDTIKFSINIDYYKSQVESDIGVKNYVSITTRFKVDTSKYMYTYEQDGSGFSITSLVNKKLYEIPLGIYEYKQIGADDYSHTIYLQHKGLWYGYYQAFIDGLSLLTSTVRSVSKSLGQFNNQNSQKQLAREIMNNKLTFKIDKVVPSGGKLEISLIAIK